MATSTIIFGMAVILAHSSNACFVQNAGPHPWLIRIWLDKPMFEPTIAHGSLLSPSRVLTGAHIVDKVLEKSIDYRRPLGPMTLAMTAYNTPSACQQTQYAQRIHLHWKFENRQNDPFKYCQLGEFALLVPFRRFETVGAPFLIPLPYDSRATDIASWMMMDGKKQLRTSEEVKPASRQLAPGNDPGTNAGNGPNPSDGPNAGNGASPASGPNAGDGRNAEDGNNGTGTATENAPKPADSNAPGGLTGPNDEVSVYMFADRDPNNTNVIETSKIPFMSWLKCVETENFKKIVGDSDMKDPGFTNFTFFCSEKIPGPKGTERLRGGVGYDWHQGAPAVVELNDQNKSMMAIGQYLFWTGESGIPFVFSTFTHYMFDFVEGNIPGPPTPNVTQPTNTFPSNKPTAYPQPTPSRIPRTEPDRRNVPTASGGDQHCPCPVWIVVVLLASNFNLLTLCTVSNP